MSAVQALLANTRALKRQEAIVNRVTFEQIAGDHKVQLEVMQLASALDANGEFVHRNVILLCSKRAAKSTSVMALMAHEASLREGVQLYFGKTKAAVRLSIWGKIWKPFIEKFYKGKCTHNDTSMVTTWVTGAVVAFTGTDDKAHVETYMGNKLRRAVIDEAQNQAPSVLNPLADEILPPSLSDQGGQMILAGTIPEVPAGKFYETWNLGEGWLKRNWSRFDNPFMGTREEQLAKLDHYLLTTKHLITDSIVRRDWFGEFVFSTDATAYPYQVQRNGYVPEEPEWLEEFIRQFQGDPMFEHIHRTIRPNDGSARHGMMAAVPVDGVEVFACAIDPGAKDRFTIEVIGWGSGTPIVQHVFEFSSKRKAHLRWSQLDPIRRKIQEVYNPSWWFYDAQGSSVVLDTFVGDTGLPALMPAAKAGLHGQVERVGDLMVLGHDKTMVGSAAEEDYQKAQWNADARAKLQWSWDSKWHPDPAESKRYATAAYFDTFEPAEAEKTKEEKDRERHELAVRRRNAQRAGMILDEDMDAAIEADQEDVRWD